MEESRVDNEFLAAILNAIREEIRMHPLLDQEAERDESRLSRPCEAASPAAVRNGEPIGLVWASLKAVVESLGAIPTGVGALCVTALARLRNRGQRT